MSLRIVIWIMLTFAASVAQANTFNINRDYSHTLPDDSIVYPGKPGEGPWCTTSSAIRIRMQTAPTTR
ncbi:hypothetical protein M0D69_06230 [Caballeronia sp. SEWSISQ10-4 2]|uniref:hypothetical protein n=1 Tax=Caballeronia sp. SEWSISQ10-4 2 TaxID=2937438 RepID=UPI00264A9E00|nr:hypothetical protein [Caballeronia sp. SEWSISQ10-4 2]MDN7177622.1 hypothetical protein [Caballeronia sp. SEWSISQ10-4 2]